MSVIEPAFDPLGILPEQDEALVLPPEDARLSKDLERAKGISPRPCPRCGYVEGVPEAMFSSEVAEIRRLVRMAFRALRRA